MATRFKLSRRAFLAGIGGTAVSLPFLEAMGDPTPVRAGGLEYPNRFLIAFAGMSIGGDGDGRTLMQPAMTGTGYDLPRSLAPLAMHEVQDDFSIVTGLKIPWNTGSGVPAAGRPPEFHASTMAPLLCGVRTSARDEGCDGPTSDQLVAAAIAGDTRFRSLAYRVQAGGYRGGEGPRSAISYRRDGSGNMVRVAPIASPRVAYDSLFTGFVPDDPVELERRRFLLDQDGSILDLVSERANRLMSRVGSADRVRLQRHFDEIRDLERRIAEMPIDTGGACELLRDPGEDTPIEILGGGGGDSTDTGYANEQQRATVLCDLLHMAFTCDLTRSASLMFTFAQSFMNVGPLIGNFTDLHNLGHGGGDADDISDAIGWHVGHIARLARKLKDTPEGDLTVLDRTAIVFVTEGGHGYDPEGGRANSSHSSENMSVLVGGHAGGLRAGQHIRAVDRHPGSVILSAMNAVGVEGPFGEVETRIEQLFA